MQPVAADPIIIRPGAHRLVGGIDQTVVEDPQAVEPFGVDALVIGEDLAAIGDGQIIAAHNRLIAAIDHTAVGDPVRAALELDRVLVIGDHGPRTHRQTQPVAVILEPIAIRSGADDIVSVFHTISKNGGG